MGNSDGDGVSPGTKRKRVELCVKTKLEILDMMEKGINRNVIMSKFNIGSSTYYDIKKNKQKLNSFIAATETSTKRIEIRTRLKEAKLSQLDAALFTWFTEKRSEGVHVTGPMLITTAKELHKKIDNGEPCSFSEGWLRNFKYRHGITTLESNGEQRQEAQAAADTFMNNFKQLVNEHQLSPSQIYNADETRLLWRCLPDSILAGSSETELNKDHITVLLCANSSGTHRLKPLVVNKSNETKAFKNLTSLPVTYETQPNAWMTSEIFKSWFFRDFVPAVKENFKKEGLPEESKAVLVLSNCPVHPDSSELICGNIFAISFPSSASSIIQPMKQGVVQTFKMKYRGSFMNKLVDAEKNVAQLQSAFNMKYAVFAVTLAWENINETMLRKCWKKLWSGITLKEQSVTDEKFNDNISTRNFVDSPEMHAIDSLTDTEIDQWIDQDIKEPIVEIMTDPIIIKGNLIKQEQEETEEKEDKDIKPIHTWQQAEEFISKFVEFAECCSSYNNSEVINLHLHP